MSTAKTHEGIQPKVTLNCQPFCIEFVEGSQQHKHRMVNLNCRYAPIIPQGKEKYGAGGGRNKEFWPKYSPPTEAEG